MVKTGFPRTNVTEKYGLRSPQNKDFSVQTGFQSRAFVIYVRNIRTRTVYVSILGFVTGQLESSGELYCRGHEKERERERATAKYACIEIHEKEESVLFVMAIVVTAALLLVLMLLPARVCSAHKKRQ